MKTEVFEKAILQQDLKPVEVKLRKNQVIWFAAIDERTKEMVVYDKTGMAFLIDKFDWHGQELNIKYKEDNPEGNVMVNNQEAKRCPFFRLWD